MTEQATWCGDEHISTQTHTTELLFITPAVVTAIDSHAADAIEIIAEALHGLVNLLGQFTGRRHDDAVNSILGIVAVIELREDRQQIGSSLARSCLCHTQHVVAIEDLGDTAFLDGGHLVEAHVIKRIEDIVVQICFFKFHFCKL